MNLFLVVLCIEYYFLYVSNSYELSYDSRVTIFYFLPDPRTSYEFDYIEEHLLQWRLSDVTRY